MQKQNIKIFYLLFLIISLGVILVWVQMARHGFPLLSEDTICFLPASYALNDTGELINKFYNPTSTPNGHFLFYPPFFPFVISKLFFFDNSELKVYTALVIVQITAYLLTIGLFFKLIQGYLDQINNKWLLWSVAILIPLLLASAFPAGVSRPEALCRLLLVILLFLLVYWRSFTGVIAGIIIFTSLFTSPIFGIYSGFIFLNYLLYTDKLSWRVLLLAISGFILSAIIFSFVYPYSYGELLINMQKHAHNAIFARKERFNIKDLIRFHIVGKDFPLGLILAISCVAIYVPRFLKKTNSKYPWIFRIALIAFILTVSYFTFNVLPMEYYLYVLSPIFYLAISVFILRFIVNQKNTPVTKLACLFIPLLFCTGLIRNLLIYKLSNYESQKSLNALFQSKQKIGNSKVAFTTAFWPIFYNSPRACIYDSTKADYAYIVYQQTYSSIIAPKKIKGYSIFRDDFSATPLTLFNKIKIANTLSGYEFVIYKSNTTSR